MAPSDTSQIADDRHAMPAVWACRLPGGICLNINQQAIRAHLYGPRPATCYTVTCSDQDHLRMWTWGIAARSAAAVLKVLSPSNCAFLFSTPVSASLIIMFHCVKYPSTDDWWMPSIFPQRCRSCARSPEWVPFCLGHP